MTHLLEYTLWLAVLYLLFCTIGCTQPNYEGYFRAQYSPTLIVEGESARELIVEVLKERDEKWAREAHQFIRAQEDKK